MREIIVIEVKCMIDGDSVVIAGSDMTMGHMVRLDACATEWTTTHMITAGTIIGREMRPLVDWNMTGCVQRCVSTTNILLIEVVFSLN